MRFLEAKCYTHTWNRTYWHYHLMCHLLQMTCSKWKEYLFEIKLIWCASLYIWYSNLEHASDVIPHSWIGSGLHDKWMRLSSEGGSSVNRFLCIDMYIICHYVHNDTLSVQTDVLPEELCIPRYVERQTVITAQNHRTLRHLEYFYRFICRKWYVIAVA